MDNDTTDITWIIVPGVSGAKIAVPTHCGKTVIPGLICSRAGAEAICIRCDRTWLMEVLGKEALDRTDALNNTMERHLTGQG